MNVNYKSDLLKNFNKSPSERNLRSKSKSKQITEDIKKVFAKSKFIIYIFDIFLYYKK